jgi:hypothetical protein
MINEGCLNIADRSTEQGAGAVAEKIAVLESSLFLIIVSFSDFFAFSSALLKLGVSLRL